MHLIIWTTLVDNTKKVVQHAKVHQATGRVEDFYARENLGIECRPRCGSCKCGKCHLGGKNMSLKEEREYKLIKENFVNMPKKCDSQVTPGPKTLDSFQTTDVLHFIH